MDTSCARWCTRRVLHRGLEFSPTLHRSNGIKYPDFLWDTGPGVLYCECKKAETFMRREAVRLNALCAAATDALGDLETWPSNVRLDIVLTPPIVNKTEAALRRVVKDMAVRVRGGELVANVVESGFTACVSSGADQPPVVRDALRVFNVRVGSEKAVLLDVTSAYVSLAVPANQARARALKSLLREARTQLPEDGPGAVFLDLPAVANDQGEALFSVLMNLSSDTVRWAAQCVGDLPTHAAWRPGQVFDGRLVVEAGHS